MTASLTEKGNEQVKVAASPVRTLHTNSSLGDVVAEVEAELVLVGE
jgi:hypothetical protein